MNTEPPRHLLGKSIEVGVFETLCGEIVTDDTVICCGPHVTCGKCNTELYMQQQRQEANYHHGLEW